MILPSCGDDDLMLSIVLKLRYDLDVSFSDKQEFLSENFDKLSTMLNDDEINYYKMSKISPLHELMMRFKQYVDNGRTASEITNKIKMLKITQDTIKIYEKYPPSHFTEVCDYIMLLHDFHDKIASDMIGKMTTSVQTLKDYHMYLAALSESRETDVHKMIASIKVCILGMLKHYYESVKVVVVLPPWKQPTAWDKKPIAKSAWGSAGSGTLTLIKTGNNVYSIVLSWNDKKGITTRLSHKPTRVQTDLRLLFDGTMVDNSMVFSHSDESSLIRRFNLVVDLYE